MRVRVKVQLDEDRWTHVLLWVTPEELLALLWPRVRAAVEADLGSRPYLSVSLDDVGDV